MSRAIRIHQKTAKRQGAPINGRGIGTNALAPETALLEALQASPGRPLDPRVRRKMEGRLGYDFGQVRVHTDEKAAAATQVLEAQAFTLGQDIFFAADAYQPDTPEGEARLVHELTHAVQQGQRELYFRSLADETIQDLNVPQASEGRETEAEAVERGEALESLSPGPSQGEVARRTLAPEREQRVRRERGDFTLWQPAQVLDPALIIERLVEVLLRSLRADPEDRRARVRHQLEHLADDTRQQVLERARERATQSEWSRLSELAGENSPPGTENASADTPASAESELASEETPTDETGEPPTAEAQTEAETDAGTGSSSATGTGADAGVFSEAAPSSETQASGAEGDRGVRTTSEGTQPAEATTQDGVLPETAKASDETEPGPEVKPVEAQTEKKQAESAGGEAGGGEVPARGKAGGQAPVEGGAPTGAEAGGGEPPAARVPGFLQRDPPAAGRGAGAGAQARSGEGLLQNAPAGAGAATTAEQAASPAGMETAPTAQAAEEPAGDLHEMQAAQNEAEAAAEAVTGVPELSPEVLAPDPGPPPESSDALQPPDLPLSGQITPFPRGGAVPPRPDQQPLPETHAPAQTEENGPAASLEPLEAAAEMGAANAGPVPAEAPQPAAGAEISGGPAEPETASTPESGPAPAEAVPSQEPDLAAGGGAPEAPEISSEAAPAAGMPGEGDLAQAGEAAQPGGAEPADPACMISGAEPAPAPEADGGGGMCGGGGGDGAADQETPAPPADVSQEAPTQALASVSNLPPVQMQAALGGVKSAAQRAVGEHRQDLQAEPPSMERPSGVPANRDAEQPLPPIPEPRGGSPGEVTSVPSGGPGAQPEAASAPAGLNAPAETGVRTPTLPAEGQIRAEDAHQIQSAVRDLPTHDPALDVDAGSPPELVLDGDADPQQAQDQRHELNQSVDHAHQQGREDLVQDMGENDIFPQVPNETLSAQIGGEGGAADGGTNGSAGASGAAGVAGGAQAAAGPVQQGGNAGGSDGETLSIVAEQERGDDIRGAARQARSDMQAGEQKQVQDAADERAKKQQEIDQAVQENAAEQREARQNARQDVQTERGHWSSEQQDLVTNAGRDADQENQREDRELAQHRTEGIRSAQGHIRDGNRDINNARRDAEYKAQQERQRAQQETSSGGFFSWLGSKVTSFFNRIKNAIKSAFDAARRLVRAAIETAQRLAAAAIDLARRAIVSAIQSVGRALVAIGDRVLGAFPGLRDRFRRLIRGVVNRAVAAVNELADRLKRGVQALLDLLGRALEGLLNVLEQAYLAAVDAINSVVQSAIQFARSVVEALAAFAALIRDIAGDPGGWLSKLGRAVVDGIRNCLWAAFKAAVRNWFNQKVQEVLGLAMMLWNILVRGCMSLAQIGSMAWEALKAAIPGVLIRLLIEKLVAMIVPAAGAIMTIIEGLRAAWGTISRIITAFQLFFDFLKAVKSGNAAGKFAKAVAAAAIVVIDFVANWLLQRLRGPASAIGGRLRVIAQRIGGGLRRGAAAVRRGAVAAIRRVRSAGRAAASGMRRGARALGRQVRRAGRALARTRVGQAAARGAAAIRRSARVVGRAVARSRVGRAAIRTYGATRRTIQRARASFRRWRQRRRQRRQATAQQRLDRAARAIGPRIERMLHRGVRGPILWARLLAWRVWYRLSRLYVRGRGRGFSVVAQVNPNTVVANGVELDVEPLLIYLAEVAQEILTHPQVEAGARQILSSRQYDLADPENKTPLYTVGQGTNLPALTRASMQMQGLPPGRAQNLLFAGEAPAGVSRQLMPFSTRPTDVRDYRDRTQGTVNLLVRRVSARGSGAAAQFWRRLLRLEREGLPVPSGEKYEHIVPALESMGSPKDTADAFEGWMRTRTLPPNYAQHRNTFAMLATLTVAQETERNPAALAMLPLTLDVARQRGWQAAFQKFYPMSADQAVEQARALNWHLAEWQRRQQGGAPVETPLGRLPSGISTEANAALQRERGLIQAWLNTLDLKIDQADRATVEQRIRQRIRERIYQAYGLTAT